MAWRGVVAGLLLAAALVLPLPLARPGAAADEAIILSTYRSYTGANNRLRFRRHAGVDFGAYLGAPVLAAADGVVSRMIKGASGCGQGVVIEHPGFKRWTTYCHMQSTAVSAGQQVRRGEFIGRVGTSGHAGNIPHVHLELCTLSCVSHADGDLAGTADPLAIADGCFAPGKAYPRDRLVLTFPVACRFWIRGP